MRSSLKSRTETGARKKDRVILALISRTNFSAKFVHALRVLPHFRCRLISRQEAKGAILQPLRLADQGLEKPQRDFLEKTLHPEDFNCLRVFGRMSCTESAEEPVVFSGKRGELRHRYREGQEDQLGALGLVVK
jgi:hypothetical protein